MRAKRKHLALFAVMVFAAVATAGAVATAHQWDGYEAEDNSRDIKKLIDGDKLTTCSTSTSAAAATATCRRSTRAPKRWSTTPNRRATATSRRRAS